jgi:hypothetical protein
MKVEVYDDIYADKNENMMVNNSLSYSHSMAISLFHITFQVLHYCVIGFHDFSFAIT